MPSTTRYIVGAGGHARVVIATAVSSGVGRDQLRVVDDNPALVGAKVGGVDVVGGSLLALDDPHAVATLAIGNNAVRAQLASKARCAFASYVHSSAVVEAATIGHGSVVFAQAVIQPDSTLGSHVIVNTSASIDHDGNIGDFVHLAPGVRLAGNVTVGARSFLGVGVVVIPGIRIGCGVTVGAGAVVIADIPDGATYVGVPARPIVKRDSKS